jgi:hypothetical protein
MSPAIEKILAENNTLTPAEQRELLEFLSQNDTSSLRATAQLVNEIKGKYSFVATSSEDFQPESRRKSISKTCTTARDGNLHLRRLSDYRVLARELGADAVSAILVDPAHACLAHALNLCKVYYDFYRSSGELPARGAINDVFALGVQLRDDLSVEDWQPLEL